MSERELAGPPQGPVQVPEAVRRLSAGHPVEAVWLNQLGGLSFRVEDPRAPRFVKWSPPGGPDLQAEAIRLRWASAYARVPEVLDEGSDASGQWLLTAALAGESAVSARWCARPDAAARAIGLGLRLLHDDLPVTDCPFFHWSAPERVAEWGLAGWGVEGWRPPPADRLVVCHGDPCAPNTLIGEDGRPSGHVDLGSLGVADRWADLAIATWSLEWNYGPGHEAALLEAYGIAPDPERTAYYRSLWDVAT